MLGSLRQWPGWACWASAPVTPPIGRANFDIVLKLVTKEARGGTVDGRDEKPKTKIREIQGYGARLSPGGQGASQA